MTYSDLGRGASRAGSPAPDSLQELLLEQVPPLMVQIQHHGGPNAADLEAARLFSETLASRGDMLLFPPSAFADRARVKEIQQALCQSVATAAFCPGGIRVFGLHLLRRRTEMAIQPQEPACIGAYPVDVRGARKSTAAFYTPMQLITASGALLDTALQPQIVGACASKDPEQALLALTIGDPSCGSGAFLFAAAERIAQHLARIRHGDREPSAEQWRAIRRAVVARCLYGVDINPAAVELCKLTLSLQAIDPTRPFPFLDAHILCGNSILGATPALLRKGIPDEAFEPIEGDDPKICAAWKRQNRAERAERQGVFASDSPSWAQVDCLLAHFMDRIEAMPDDTGEAWVEKQRCYTELLHSDIYQYSVLRANAWCAAFVWKKTGEFPCAITEAVFRAIERDPGGVAPWMREEIDRLARQYQFFHWHLAFPHVLRAPGTKERTGA